MFAGTRVPVQTLLDYLEEGDTLDDFLEDFSDRKSRACGCGSRTGQRIGAGACEFSLTSAFRAGWVETCKTTNVRTVPEMGWASKENGVLLALASGNFDVLITTDQRLSYQQAVSNFGIAVIVLVARRNKLASHFFRN